ncbi:MAG TPA: hypothetical protein ENN39_09800 [Desulfonatronum sp.]|nr:hypothetical protein [Desulfonatronum sp.]
MSISLAQYRHPSPAALPTATARGRTFQPLGLENAVKQNERLYPILMRMQIKSKGFFDSMILACTEILAWLAPHLGPEKPEHSGFVLAT